MIRCLAIAPILVSAVALSVLAEEPAQPLTSVAFPIGVEGIPEYGDAASMHMAEDLKLNLVMQWLSWKGNVPYSYSWTAAPDKEQFAKHLERLKKEGYIVALTDTTVHMTESHLPDHLKGRLFNDPEVIDHFTSYLTGVMNQLGDYIDYFNIGNEIDLYFGGKDAEWVSYPEFFKAGADVIRAMKPHIKIGVVTKAKTDTERYWEPLRPYCDYFAVTYYAPCSSLSSNPTAEGLKPESENHFAREFEGAIALAGDKPVFIMEVGCPTHQRIESTPELQVAFIKQLFEWLPQHDERLLGMLWLTFKDWNRGAIKTALTGHLAQNFLEIDSFMDFLCSLGLVEEGDAPKVGLAAFKDAMHQYRKAEATQ